MAIRRKRTQDHEVSHERFIVGQKDDRPVRVMRPDQSDCRQLKKFKHDTNRLPHAWLECPNFGQEISGIVPSKVPLGKSFDDCISPGKRYSFEELLHQLKLKGVELGMVVDLTNTNRYYSTTEFKKGLRYLKIRCQGHDAVPDDDLVNTFVFEVTQFILNENKKDSRKLVLVHCTHGHNRTGYMIVHYLMRTRQVSSVTEAIRRFAEARPPGIYKQDYIKALYDFYHETKPDLFLCPPTPEWKRSFVCDLNDAAAPNEGYGAPCASNKEEPEDVAIMTIDDVLGDEIPEQQELQLRQFCYDMLKLTPRAGGHMHFPGSHPVSLDRDNLNLLRQRYYCASWKADGTRYMLLLTPGICYLIDRNFKFRLVQMRFPCRNMTQFHHYTLLDGEMVIDTFSVEEMDSDPDNPLKKVKRFVQKQERRFLIYDLVAVNGISIKEMPFHERWKLIDKEVIQPRNDERQSMTSNPNPYRYDQEPFKVRRKDFWLLSTVGKLLKDLIPNLSHPSDGLIFQGRDDPYVPRAHEGLLKWKYPKMNSVDFLFKIQEDGLQSLYLLERGRKRIMEGNRVVFEDGTPTSYSGKIIECSWNLENSVWNFMRVRTDKSMPNELNTYNKVMRSIRDNITEDELLDEIRGIVSLPLYAHRTQRDINVQRSGKPHRVGTEIC